MASRHTFAATAAYIVLSADQATANPTTTITHSKSRIVKRNFEAKSCNYRVRRSNAAAKSTINLQNHHSSQYRRYGECTTMSLTL